MLNNETVDDWTDGRARQWEKEIQTQRAPSLLRSPQIAKDAITKSIYCIGSQAGQETGSNEEALRIGEFTFTRFQINKPDICDMEQGLPVVCF